MPHLPIVVKSLWLPVWGGCGGVVERIARPHWLLQVCLVKKASTETLRMSHVAGGGMFSCSIEYIIAA